ncbi:Hydroxymethylpyrimidine ABC transporter, transmembrane component [Lachnospiraceae bacterium TWA4]|nr:Hydroxymethylpyrimidine ABC transporter, transmembrane component [Lachnospiraceae bacterium TWA4]
MTQNHKLFLKKYHRDKQMIFVVRIAILVGIVLLWQFLAKVGIINEFIFSSPLKMGEYISSNLSTLIYHTLITLAETLASFFFVTIFSLILAIILWSSERVSAILEPYFVVLNSLPKSALAPVLIVWIGNNVKTVIVTGILIAVFSAAITLTTSLNQTDKEKIKLIESMGGRKIQILNKVAIPSSIPVFIATMKVNIGLCLVGVIIGEFLAANAGLGYLIIYGSQTFKMTMVMSSIVILCLLSAILYQMIEIVEKHMNIL